MTVQGLIDLEELILTCKTTKAKQHIAEAVACYRAGAYRSSIVATWIAVVYDVLDKLRELDLAGDAQAKQALSKLEGIRESNDFKRASEFERDILELAKDKFQLLSHIEHNDLARLQQDRHRCAHPTMQTSEDPYQPSAELARSHIRNAVTHLLSQPPVQGRAALDRIWADIRSDYFPSDADSASIHFKSGPLGRARPSLIRDVVVGLSKTLLQEAYPDVEGARMFAALSAVCEMYPQITREVLDEKLDGIVSNLESISDWLIGGSGGTRASHRRA